MEQELLLEVTDDPGAAEAPASLGCKEDRVLLFSGSGRHRCQGREDDARLSPASAFSPEGSEVQALDPGARHTPETQHSQNQNAINRGMGPGGEGRQGGASFRAVCGTAGWSIQKRFKGGAQVLLFLSNLDAAQSVE